MASRTSKKERNRPAGGHTPAPPSGTPRPEAKGLGGRRSRRLAAAALIATVLVAAWLGWRFYPRTSRMDGIRNVVLISIDTCRANHLSCYGYKRPTTPNIDAVARDGVLFKLALTPVPITLPAHSSMLTGTYPPVHGVHANEGPRVPDRNVTLAELMREAGCQTAAFVGAFPLDSTFGLNQGFDTYDDHFTERGEKAFYNERKAEDVSRPAIAWLEKHGDKPFFLFLHYFDPHAPYAPPPPFASTYADDLYAGEIAYTDFAIGQVLDKLRALGLYENSLIIITGDHGEGLDEHGEPSHGFFIYQSTLHVPLIVKAPESVKGRQVAEAVSLVDIVPTVLGLTGRSTPPQVQGADLRSYLEGGSGPDRSRPIYCESQWPGVFDCSPLHGVVEGQWKYIRAPKPELYDLGRDPGEQNNVVGNEPQTARRLRGRLEEELKDMQSLATERTSADIDPETRKRLESLGYVGGVARQADFDPNKEDPKDFVAIWARLDSAYGLYVRNSYEEARKECLEIVALRPGLFLAHRLLGQIALDQGHATEAIECFSAVLSILTGLKDTPARMPHAVAGHEISVGHMGLGNALASAGKLQEAAAQFEAALSIEPRLLEAHNNLGLALREQGKADEAVTHFRKALEIKPDYADAYNNLGVTLREQGKADEAVAHFRKALEINPRYAEANYNLGLVLREQGKADEAAAHFRMAVEIKPGYVAAWNGLGVTLLRQGKTDEGLACFQKALEIRPDYAEALFNIGLLREMQGKLDEALIHYEKALKAQPGFPQGLKRLAAVLSRQGRFDEASAAYEEVLKASPEDVEARYGLGFVLSQQGKPAEALVHWREGLRLSPDNVLLLNGTAWTLATSPEASVRNGKEAVELAKKAVQPSGGKVPEFLDTLAAAYAEAGQFPEAVKTAEEALALATNQKNAALVDDLGVRIKLYKSGLAFRETKKE